MLASHAADPSILGRYWTKVCSSNPEVTPTPPNSSRTDSKHQIRQVKQQTLIVQHEEQDFARMASLSIQHHGGFLNSSILRVIRLPDCRHECVCSHYVHCRTAFCHA